MEFKNGVSVFSAEGDKLGRIEQVVVDPRTEEVTHAIVKQGFLLTEDKVLPTDLIAKATDERVTLKQDAGDLEAMSKFRETEYVEAVVPLDAPPPPEWYETGDAWSLHYLPPDEPEKDLIPDWSDIEGPQYIRQTDRNVPEDAVVLEENAEVVSADGVHVGDVDEVFTNAENDRITHLLVSRGELFEKERLVPVSWIDQVGEGTVHLAVESALLGRLQPYPDDRTSDGASTG